ncbi:MAG: AraC family transcriptional regulator [Clostridia bacterium]|nr:AraC family transcriptional regulator [Clostridia bacterium]
MDIKKIHIAHEFILDRVHKLEYPLGRGLYGLVYVLSGKAEYRFFTGERITVTDGDVLFLSPHAAYSIVTEKEFKHYTVNFDIHEETSRLGDFDSSHLLFQSGNTEQLERTFRKLTGIWRSKKAGFEMQAIACLYELISLFYFDYFGKEDNVNTGRLLPAKEHIEQHFKLPISLEQLSGLCNMSVTNFRREWKKIYSETPLQYRDSIRLYYAKEYLSSGYYTVSEVAEKCGFDDISYFVRFFKKHVGVSPGALKKQFMGF